MCRPEGSITPIAWRIFSRRSFRRRSKLNPGRSSRLRGDSFVQKMTIVKSGAPRIHYCAQLEALDDLAPDSSNRRLSSQPSSSIKVNRHLTDEGNRNALLHLCKRVLVRRLLGSTIGARSRWPSGRANRSAFLVDDIWSDYVIWVAVESHSAIWAHARICADAPGRQSPDAHHRRRRCRVPTAGARWVAGIRPRHDASSLVAPSAGGAVSRIAVTGEQWWWRVRYLPAAGGEVVLANEIRLPVGEPVEFELDSAGRDPLVLDTGARREDGHDPGSASTTARASCRRAPALFAARARNTAERLTP